MDPRFFDLTATKAYGGLALRRTFFGPLGLFLAAVFLLPFAERSLTTHDARFVGIALAIVLFAMLVAYAFTKHKLLNDSEHPFSDQNDAGFLSTEMVRALARTKSIDASTLLEAALLTDRAHFMLREMGIDRQAALRRYMEKSTKTLDHDAWLRLAMEAMPARKEVKIGGSLIFGLFLQHDKAMQSLLNECDLSPKDLEKILAWECLHDGQEQPESILQPRWLLRNFGGIGRSWVMGYTRKLDQLTRDISEGIFWNRRSPIVLHKQEIENMRRIIQRASQHNILVLGKPGTGKRTLIENFTYEIRQAERHQGRAYTRVLVLQPEYLLSGTNQPDAFLLSALTQARQAGNFILVIPNIGILLANPNVKNVLLQFLQSPTMSMIALTDPQDYHSMIKTDAMLDSLFEKVPLEDAADDDTMNVLMAQYFTLERKGIRITYKALQAILELSKRYIGKGGFPGRAMNVMEDAILTAIQKHDRIVTESHIREVVSLKSHMNVRQVTDEERGQLLKLEDMLKTKIIGQEEPLHGLVNALKRAQLDIGTRKRPLGTFLFLGPTGVGKTETAKVLADAYFGSADHIVRLDMNEYSTEDSIYEIIGSPDPGARHSEGFLAKKIQDEPFSLVLLDEIEKAHPHVLNLFLQILDEGQLTDGMGVRTSFRNTIIIATSNAGALFIRDYFREKPQSETMRANLKKELVDVVLKQKLFSPEFLNRFDDVLLYYPLTEPEAKKLAVLMLDKLVKDFDAKRGVELLVDMDAVAALARRGYSVEFGAREMRRVMTHTVETYLANYMLDHDVKRGDTITIHQSDLHL